MKETLFCLLDFSRFEVEGACRFGEIGIEEGSNDADREGDDAADYQKPLQSSVAEDSVQILITSRLKVATENSGESCGAVEECDMLGTLLFCVPRTGAIRDAGKECTFA